MHLHYPSYAVRPQPNRWLVVDDFGTEYNSFLAPQYSSSDLARGAFLDSADQDPDFFRLDQTEPTRHYLRESMSFSTAFGLCVELDLHIDFWHYPAWDDFRGVPLSSREDGAKVTIEYITVNSRYGDQLDACETSRPELIELCWQYLALEQARELAEATARAKTRAAEAAR